MHFSIFFAFSIAFFPGISFAVELSALRGVRKEGKDESKNRDLILGGVDATSGEFPYFVRIGNGCAGSLVDKTHVLTAAHCERLLAIGSTVTIGEYEPAINSEGKFPRKIKQVIYHPEWDSETPGFDYDAALIVLDNPVNATIPVTLSEIEPDHGEMLTTIGLGTEADGSLPNKLQKANYYSSSCSPYGAQIGPSMICAGDPNGGVGACQADDGGPVVLSANPMVQVGISSWGQGCGNPDYPDVLTNVAEILGWINQQIDTVRPDCFCDNLCTHYGDCCEDCPSNKLVP